MISSSVIQLAVMLMNLRGKINVYVPFKGSIRHYTYRIEVEYISNFTDCAWMPITHSVLPSSCDDISTTYFQPTQLVSRYVCPSGHFVSCAIAEMCVLYICSTWTRVTLPLPPGAFSSDTQFRWKSEKNCQNCQYALDDSE